jgi:hypothetical protein
MKRKITKIVESQNVIKDNDGSVISETESSDTTFYISQEPPYVKLYLETILYLKDLPRALHPVLVALLRKIPWASEEQEIAINQAVKKRLASDLSCSISKIDHALTDFVKGEILYRVDTGLYCFNPHLFGKGEWKDIEKLRLSVTFDSGGKTVYGMINRKGKSADLDLNTDTSFSEYFSKLEK